MPDPDLDDNTDVDIEEYFTRFRQWLILQGEKFHNDVTEVAGIKDVLLGTAMQWYNHLPASGIPTTLNNLQRDFFAKFRIVKTRQEWKRN